MSLEEITNKYFNSGFSTKRCCDPDDQVNSWVSDPMFIEVKQPQWQQIIVKECQPYGSVSKVSINKYAERRLNQAYKEVEQILEADFGEDYSKIDRVLDRIPEKHKSIEVQGITKIPKQEALQNDARRRSVTSLGSGGKAPGELILKKLFSSQMRSPSRFGANLKTSPRFQASEREEAPNFTLGTKNSRCISVMASRPKEEICKNLALSFKNSEDVPPVETCNTLDNHNAEESKDQKDAFGDTTVLFSNQLQESPEQSLLRDRVVSTRKLSNIISISSKEVIRPEKQFQQK